MLLRSGPAFGAGRGGCGGRSRWRALAVGARGSSLSPRAPRRAARAACYAGARAAAAALQVSPSSTLAPNAGNDRSWVFTCEDFSNDVLETTK